MTHLVLCLCRSPEAHKCDVLKWPQKGSARRSLIAPNWKIEIWSKATQRKWQMWICQCVCVSRTRFGQRGAAVGEPSGLWTGRSRAGQRSISGCCAAAHALSWSSVVGGRNMCAASLYKRMERSASASASLGTQPAADALRKGARRRVGAATCAWGAPGKRPAAHDTNKNTLTVTTEVKWSVWRRRVMTTHSVSWEQSEECFKSTNNCKFMQFCNFMQYVCMRPPALLSAADPFYCTLHFTVYKCEMGPKRFAGAEELFMYSTHLFVLFTQLCARETIDNWLLD